MPDHNIIHRLSKNTCSFIQSKNEGCISGSIWTFHFLWMLTDWVVCTCFHTTPKHWDYLPVKSTAQHAQHSSFHWHVRCSSVYQPHILCQSSLPASTVTLGRHLVKLNSLWWKAVLIPIPYFCCILAATAVLKLQRVWAVWRRMCSLRRQWQREEACF